MCCRATAIGLMFIALVAMLPAEVRAQAPDLLASWPTADIPLGMAVASNGLVYVGTQSGGSALAHIYTQRGVPAGEIGGSSPETYGVGFLHSGELLVAEYYSHIVNLFSPGGASAGTWALPGNNALFLAVDNLDDVYITDDNGDHMRKVSSGGAVLADWSTPHPAGVAFLNGLVYVAGMWNGIMSVYSPNGTLAASFPTGCTWAEQLSVDSSGNLLLTDHGLHQLKCFRPDGTLLWTLGPSVPDYGPGICDFFSVVPGAGGTILAGDYANRRVLILGARPTPTRLASWGSLKAKFR